jgi:hypothetical protein
MAGILSMASTIIVMDISRATTFIFPLIIVSLSVLVRYNVPLYQLRLVSACSAAISLIAPNLELITLEIFAWNPSLLMKYIQSSLGYSRILGVPW